MSFTDPTGHVRYWLPWLRDKHQKWKLWSKELFTTRRCASRLCMERQNGIICLEPWTGTQLESNRGNHWMLHLEIVDEIKAEIPVLIDGGIRKRAPIVSKLWLWVQMPLCHWQTFFCMWIRCLWVTERGEISFGPFFLWGVDPGPLQTRRTTSIGQYHEGFFNWKRIAPMRWPWN